jgi:hypothetical protein
LKRTDAFSKADALDTASGDTRPVTTERGVDDKAMINKVGGHVAFSVRPESNGNWPGRRVRVARSDILGNRRAFKVPYFDAVLVP